jgi:hypothetical protein
MPDLRTWIRPQQKEMDHTLKKIGLVAIATIGLSLAATPAFAPPATPPNHHIAKCGPTCGTRSPTFGTAYWTFIDGGADLGRGAAELLAGAYTGIALTPALLAHPFSNGPCRG